MGAAYATTFRYIHTLPNGDLVALLNINQICISPDHGHIWIPILNERGYIAVTAIGELYVSTALHLYRTINESISWDTLPPVPQMINERFNAFYTSTLFVIGEAMYRSTDHGLSWSKVVNGISIENSDATQLAGTFGGVLFYVTGSQSISGRYYSSDDGRTWKLISPGGAKRVTISAKGLIGVTDGAGISIYDLNGIVIKATPSPINEPNFLGVAASPTGEFWAWFGPYIFKMNPKTQSEFSPVVLPNGVVTEIFAPAAGTVIVNSKGLYDGGWYNTTDKGTTWKEIPQTFISPSASDSAHNIFVISGAAISKSTDGGASWDVVSPQLSSSLTSIAIDSQGFIYAGSGEGIFRTTDGGITWDQLNAGLTDKNVLSLAVNSSHEIFAGTSQTIFHSTDNAMTWSALPFISPDNSGISTLSLNSKGDLLAVVRNSGVFRSQDNGQTWNLLGSKLFAKVNALMSMPNGDVFVATNKGVFFLEAGGTWVGANSGLGSLNVLCMTHDQQGSIYLGTDGSGVFRSIQLNNKIQMGDLSSSTTRIFPNPSLGEITVNLSGFNSPKIQVF